MIGTISTRIRTTIIILSLLLTALVGCTSSGDSSLECDSDSDCFGGLICGEHRTCICRTNDACGESKFCNTFGSCQERPPCIGNVDCAAGEICNSYASGGAACIPATQCGSNVHCPFEEYCDPSSSTCVPGCRNTGDCALGHVCVAGTCLDGQAQDGDCTLCPVGTKPDSNYCDYGEACSPYGDCAAHIAGTKLCADCTQSQSCGSGMICLIDNNSINPNNPTSYCAPACSTDLDCPNGYPSCGPIITVSKACTSDGECTPGARCLRGAEGTTAFCSCVSNADCLSTPLCMGGKCLNLPFISCSSTSDCEVECIFQDVADQGSVGLCQTRAKGCGKAQGVTCNELSLGSAACRRR